MKRISLVLKVAVLVGSLWAMSPAKSTIITDTIDFTATNFQPFANATPDWLPSGFVLSGSLNIAYDDTTNFNDPHSVWPTDSIVNLSLSLNVPFSGPLQGLLLVSPNLPLNGPIANGSLLSISTSYYSLTGDPQGPARGLNLTFSGITIGAPLLHGVNYEYLTSQTSQGADWQEVTSSGSIVSFTTTAAPIPEPETYAMLLAGLGLLGTVARQRAKQQ